MSNTTYLEYTDDKSSKFWEITVADTEYTVRYGKIGTEGRTQTKTFDSEAEAREAADKMIASKTKKGYAAPSGGAANTSSPEPISLTFEQVIERFPSLAEPHPRVWAKEAGTATVYEGDLQSDTPTIVALGKGNAMVIVDGNLTLTANAVEWGSGDGAPVLLVTGNMCANHIGFFNSGAVVVEGDLDAKTLLGAMGDDGGTLRVVGDTRVELLVASSYFQFFFEGGVNAGRCLGSEAEEWFPDYISLGDIDEFVEELGESGEVEEWDLWDRIVAGEPIFAD